MERIDPTEASARIPGAGGDPVTGGDLASSPDAPVTASDSLATVIEPDWPPLTRGLVIGIGAICLVTAAMYAAIQAIGVERIRATVEAAGPWGPIVYLALKVATFVIAPLSSAPLRMSAGAIFGFWEGVLLTVLGTVLGGSINFWISRLVGRRLVVRCIGSSGMDRVDRLVGRLGDWRALVLARIVLAPVWDFVSYAAGFTRIRFGVYLLVAIVGDVIPSMLFVGIGTSLVEDPKMLLAVLAGSALLYALLSLVRRRAPDLLSESGPSRSEA